MRRHRAKYSRDVFTTCWRCGEIGGYVKVNPEAEVCTHREACDRRIDAMERDFRVEGYVTKLDSIFRDVGPNGLIELTPVEIAERYNIHPSGGYILHRRAQEAVMGITDAEPPANQKTAILRALLHHGKAGTVQDLLDAVLADGFAIDMHSLVHVVWTLQKQRLVKFYEHKRRGSPAHGSSLSAIHLTKEGQAAAEALLTREETISVAQAIQVQKAERSLADQIIELMRQKPYPQFVWKAGDIAKEWGINDDRRVQVIRVRLNQDNRFTHAGSQPGVWALKEQVEAKREADRLRNIEAEARLRAPAVAPAPAAPTPPPTPAAPAPAPVKPAVKVEPPKQNEKPVPTFAQAQAQLETDLLAGLALIDGIWQKSERRDQMVVAARILEASGEDELAIAVLSKVELSALEQEVATLVGRVKGKVPVGQTDQPSGEVHSGE